MKVVLVVLRGRVTNTPKVMLNYLVDLIYIVNRPKLFFRFCIVISNGVLIKSATLLLSFFI